LSAYYCVKITYIYICTNDRKQKKRRNTIHCWWG